MAAAVRAGTQAPSRDLPRVPDTCYLWSVAHAGVAERTEAADRTGAAERSRERDRRAERTRTARTREKPRAMPRGWWKKRPNPTLLLSESVIEQITGYLRVGAYPETAAAAAGVARKTYLSWLQRGAAAIAKRDAGHPLTESERLHASLVERTQQALAEAEIRDLERIDAAAARGIWQAAAWRLERRWPQRYAQRQLLSEDTLTKLNAEIRREIRAYLYGLGLLTDAEPADSADGVSAAVDRGSRAAQARPVGAADGEDLCRDPGDRAAV